MYLFCRLLQNLRRMCISNFASFANRTRLALGLQMESATKHMYLYLDHILTWEIAVSKGKRNGIPKKAKSRHSGQKHNSSVTWPEANRWLQASCEEKTTSTCFCRWSLHLPSSVLLLGSARLFWKLTLFDYRTTPVISQLKDSSCGYNGTRLLLLHLLFAVPDCNNSTIRYLVGISIRSSKEMFSSHAFFD